MFSQDQFAIAFLSVFLMKQQATQKDLEAMLNCLVERMESVGDQHQHTGDRLTAQGEALEQMAAQLTGLAEQVEAGGAKQQRTDFTLGTAAVCLARHSEALEQMCAAIRELTERVDAVEYLQKKMRLAQRVESAPASQAWAPGLRAQKRHQNRKSASARQRMGKRA